MLEPAGGLDRLGEAVGQAEVARIHDHELVGQSEHGPERVPLAGEGIDLVAAGPDGDLGDPVAADPLRGDPVGHVGAEDDDLVGLAIGQVAQPGEPGDDRVPPRHPPQRDAGVGVEVHAPVDMPRPLQAAEHGADQADDRRRGERGHHVEPGHPDRQQGGPEVEAEVVQHPVQGALAAERGGGDPVDRHAVADLSFRQRGRARLVGPLAAEDVDVVPPGGEVLGEVGQVLRRGGVVGPVILVDEEELGPPGGDDGVDPDGRLTPRPGRLGVARGDLRLGPDLPAGDHHLVSAWALLARYQATVLARPSRSLVGGVQPSRTSFILVTSSTLTGAPSGLSTFQCILPL